MTAWPDGVEKVSCRLVIQDRPVGEVINRALENGLLVISAGSDVLRLVPPLVITTEHVDEMIEKLKRSLE